MGMLANINPHHNRYNIKPYVLVVDDDKNIQALLATLVRTSGFTAQTAGSGKEALACIEECPPGLVVLDLMMPGMSGFDVLNRLQRRAETRHVPVIIMTGSRLTIEGVPDLYGVVRKVVRKGDLDVAEMMELISDAMLVPQTGQ